MNFGGCNSAHNRYIILSLSYVAFSYLFYFRHSYAIISPIPACWLIKKKNKNKIKKKNCMWKFLSVVLCCLKTKICFFCCWSMHCWLFTHKSLIVNCKVWKIEFSFIGNSSHTKILIFMKICLSMLHFLQIQYSAFLSQASLDPVVFIFPGFSNQYWKYNNSF